MDARQAETLAELEPEPDPELVRKLSHRLRDQTQSMMTLGPQTARLIRTAFRFEGQRKIQRQATAPLEAIMRKRRWQPGRQISFGMLPSGRLYLVDGYHRMEAVENTGLAQTFQIGIIACADMDELRHLYTSFDTVGRNRSAAHILRSSGLLDEAGVRALVLNGAETASVMLAYGLRRIGAAALDAEHRTPEGRHDLLRPWLPEVRIYDQLTEPAEQRLSRPLVTGTVIACALLTIRYQPTTAREFWGPIAENNGLLKGDPRRALVMALLERGNVNYTATIARCVTSWNAWYSKHSLMFLRNTLPPERKMLGVPAEFFSE